MSFSTENAQKNTSIQKENFYKVTATGFNHDKSTGLYINEDGWIAFNENTPSLDQSKYDAFTNEISSIPSYIYVPDSDSTPFTTSFMEKQTAQVYSNTPVLIEVLSSLIDLGDSIDEWERRGKEVDLRIYDKLEPNGTTSYSLNDAITAMAMAGNLFGTHSYFVVIAHFADNTVKISRVFERD